MSSRVKRETTVQFTVRERFLLPNKQMSNITSVTHIGFLDSIVVRVFACHEGDQGSIPSQERFFRYEITFGK